MAKHVLVITPSIKPGGGPPGYVHNLMTGVEELTKEGQLKNIFEFLGQISEQRNKATGEGRKSRSFRLAIIWMLTKMGMKPFLSKKIRAAKKKIDNADLVVFQGFQEAYLASYARRIGARIAYMPHSPSIMADEYKMLCELNGQQYEQLHYQKLKEDEALLIGVADFVVFPSKGAGKEYESQFVDELSGKKVVHIKSGVNVICEREVSKEISGGHGAVRVLFAGRYVSHKGYDLFCDAAELLGENIGDVEFMTLGDGPMKRYSPNVTNLGWRNDVFNVLKDADIVVVPNRIAYYDLLPLECAALGKPMVMTAVGGNVDQMHDLPDTLGCEVANPIQLSLSIKSAIEKFRSDPKWGYRNKLAFDSTFGVKEFAKRWDDAVEEIASQN